MMGISNVYVMQYVLICDIYENIVSNVNFPGGNNIFLQSSGMYPYTPTTIA